MRATHAHRSLVHAFALLLALLLAVVASCSAATRLHVRSSKLPSVKAATDSANASSTSLEQSCSAFAKRSAVRASVLSVACPAVCTDSNLCIYYPPSARGNCSAQYGSACFEGDSCTFECLKTAGTAGAWYITLYDSDEAFAALDATNAAYKVASVLVNASVVTKLDAFVRPSVFDQLTVAGNELASSIQEEENDVELPKGVVVKFVFPSDFLSQLKDLSYIRIENVPFPSIAGANELKFPKLEVFYATNTLLQSMPFQAKNLPALTNIDLSDNDIRKIDPGMMPAGLTAVDLSNNLLESIPEDIKSMKKLDSLSLASNPLRNLNNGSIPFSLNMFSCRNCSLQHIPADFALMKKLTDLDLSENDFSSSSQDLSILPTGLLYLYLDATGLQEVPENLQRLSELTTISFIGITFKKIEISRLPAQITSLSIANCSLSRLPSGLQDLRNLTTLNAEDNPLTDFLPNSLPESLTELYILDAKLPSIPAGALPLSIITLSIDSSGMTEAPADMAQMRQLKYLSFQDNKLTRFDLTDNLQSLLNIELNNNSLTSFSARLPATVTIDLSQNSLTDFEVLKASNLVTLNLAKNQLTQVPASVFNMSKLSSLDLRGNLIRNYTPSVEEFGFLSKLSVLSMDTNQFSSACRANDTQLLHSYRICTPGSTLRTINMDAAKSKSTSGLSILLNICLVLILVLVLLMAWHKRKLRQRQAKEREAAELKSRAEGGIWADEVLLKHRLDFDLVKRVSLLSTGKFGEVWLATYKKHKVALKRLKEKDAHRELISEFIAEIKLLSTLSHPKVVRFLGVIWTKESDVAVVTEFMARGDLRSYLDKQPRRLGTGDDEGWDSTKIRMALDVIEALVYLHSLEPALLHRDLKSRNVLLDNDLGAKVSDFGVSRLQLDDETMTACVGTVRWVAPEVLAGERYNESVDIYSLGVILSELDTHKLPYADARSDENELLSETAIANLVISGTLSVSFSAACPSEILSIAKRCTSYDPDQRPTAIQVAFELRTFLLQGHSSSTLSLLSNDRQDDEDFGEASDAPGNSQSQAPITV